MKQRIGRLIFILALIALTSAVFWTSTARAQFAYPDATPYVRLSGVLLPLDEQKPQEISTLLIFVPGQLWQFRLDGLEEVTDRNYERVRVSDLRGRSFRLYGPGSLIDPLQQPHMAGKHLTVEGRLYLKERRLLVTRVEETPALTRVH